MKAPRPEIMEAAGRVRAKYRKALDRLAVKPQDAQSAREICGCMDCDLGNPPGNYCAVQERGAEALTRVRAEYAPLLEAALSWHEFHHGSDDIQCDDICKAAAAIRAKANQGGR